MPAPGANVDLPAPLVEGAKAVDDVDDGEENFEELEIDAEDLGIARDQLEEDGFEDLGFGELTLGSGTTPKEVVREAKHM